MRDAGAAGEHRETRLAPKEVIGLLLLAILPFLDGLLGDFTYDDKVIIRDNARLSTPQRAGEILTSHYFGDDPATATTYRPVILLSYAVQRWLHGNRPVGFHAVNVALHAGVTLLLAAWLLRLGWPRGPSLAASALFAVVPIHVEAVTSLVGRAETLAALLVLSSALLWLVATRQERTAKLPYSLLLVANTLAVFVKESAAVVPGVILLGELFRGGTGDAPLRRLGALARQRGLALVGLLLPLGVLFGVRLAVLRGFLFSGQAGVFDLENPLVALSGPLRVANAVGLLFRYAAKTIVPLGLCADHSAVSLPLAETLLSARALAPLAGALLLALAAAVAWRSKPLFSFGLAFFAGTFFPASNVPFAIGTIWGERLAYLPSAGLLLAGVSLLVPRERAVPRPARLRWREVLLAAAVAAYAAATAFRNLAWRDDAALFSDTVEKAPRSAKARYNLAYHLWREKDPNGARRQLEVATTLFPRHYEAWSLLGRLHRDARRLEDAVSCYRRVTQIHPRHEAGRWGLATSLAAAGRDAEAAQAFAQAAQVLPGSYSIAFHRALFLDRYAGAERAEHEWRRALLAGRGAAPARLGLARALLALDCAAEAVREARWAVAADPGWSEPRVFLAERYEAEGKPLAAAAELARAWRTRPGDAAVAARLLELGLRDPAARARAAAAAPAIRERFGAAPADSRLAAALSAYGT